MIDQRNICYCGEYGGGVHTRSARCPGGELRTLEGELALTQSSGLPGTREPVVIAPQGNAGESPPRLLSSNELTQGPQEGATAFEVRCLKQDIERHIAIASRQATEIERLRALLDEKQHGVWCDTPYACGKCWACRVRAALSGDSSAPETKKNEAIPVAWMRGHRSHTPDGDDYDVECYYGDDPPDDKKWTPLYRDSPRHVYSSSADLRRLLTRAYNFIVSNYVDGDLPAFDKPDQLCEDILASLHGSDSPPSVEETKCDGDAPVRASTAEVVLPLSAEPTASPSTQKASAPLGESIAPQNPDGGSPSIPRGGAPGGIGVIDLAARSSCKKTKGCWLPAGHDGHCD